PSAVAAPFQALTSSPRPMTCVTEDPVSGLIYAQANMGTAFYRYRAAIDTWEPLSSAPIFSGNNGGPALLGGKIYTVYTQTLAMGIYDIASDPWTSVASPLAGSTGIIASDGLRYLYMASGARFVRFEPATGRATTLAPPPASFDLWGGLEYFDGKLYG